MSDQPDAGASARRKHLRDWLIAGLGGFVLALVAGTALRTFVLGAVVVPSCSMCDTVVPGDRVLVSKLVVPHVITIHIPYTSFCETLTIPPLRPVRIGDVLVVRPPVGWVVNAEERPAYLVKRCAGMPGDTLVFDREVLKVNGLRLHLPEEARQHMRPRVYYARAVPETVVVPPDAYFLLGDNPGESMDSRVRGTVPQSSVVGVAAMVYWSAAMPGQGKGVVWGRIGRVVR